MKVIAFYLPQFHEIPENNEWWGKGFTEWVNVKKATPLYKGHYQPRKPLNDNYYNLMDDDTLNWQVSLANQFNVYGFCFYHYWFMGKKLLEKPVEKFLNEKSLNLHFCLCWANEHWSNTWANGNSKILMEQRYGEQKDWKNHFDYLLEYFKDSRYICNDNKPLLVIYRPELIDCLSEMLEYWNQLAVDNGFNGMDFAYQNVSYELCSNQNKQMFSYAIEYQPNWALALQKQSKLQLLKKKFFIFCETKLNWNLREKMQVFYPLRKVSYSDIWESILNTKPSSEKNIPCAFVDWDNTPRKGKRGLVIYGANPRLFKRYFTRLIKKTQEEYKKDMIFVFAWNEWAEGGYLEPDSTNGYGYLEAIRSALIHSREANR